MCTNMSDACTCVCAQVCICVSMGIALLGLLWQHTRKWAAEATEIYCCTVWRQDMSNQGVGGVGFFEGYRGGLFKPFFLVDGPLSSLLASSHSF